MVDENARREKLLPSEKAWAYRMKLEAMKRKAGRPSHDENCVPLAQEEREKPKERNRKTADKSTANPQSKNRRNS